MRSLLAVLDGPVSQRLTWTLLHFLWQGIALAAVLEAVVRGFRVRRAAARYLLCVSAMLAMVACPLVTFSIVRVPTEEVALAEMKGRQTTHADGLLGGLDFQVSKTSEVRRGQGRRRSRPGRSPSWWGASRTYHPISPLYRVPRDPRDGRWSSTFAWRSRVCCCSGSSGSCC